MSFMYILLFAIVVAVLLAVISAKPTPVNGEYKQSKLESDLKFLKLGIDDVERQLTDAPECACKKAAATKLAFVKYYYARTVKGAQDNDPKVIANADSLLIEAQQNLADARADLRRISEEDEDKDVTIGKGDCGETP
ncbi:MAG: hypothetical protein IAF58_03535 [Leptolyngbya sp.]|nr:hypothetical protein [Candidatus Melainabacteria bacterium]